MFVPIGHTLFLALVAGAVAVMLAAWRAVASRPAPGEARWSAWSSTLVYAILCVLALAITVASKQLARHRANQLVAAIERYRLDHGTYPKRLADLVPQYVAKIPLASYSLFGEFYYFKVGVDAEAPSLYYITLPPFEGPTYQFDQGGWSDERARQAPLRE